MYTELFNIHHRPEPFSIYTTDVLWTDPHVSQQMLKYHLNQNTDLASRTLSTIDGAVDWIDQTLPLKNKRVCDLGCGPGLYAHRFAERGAMVQGLDFSANSIAHAQIAARDAGLDVAYTVADYLKHPLPTGQDLITMIYCDLCVLSPQQRQMLYGKIHKALRADGVFLFDVVSIEAFNAREEASGFGRNFMDGFWSQDDYFAFQNTFKYEMQKLTLDQYTIVEAHRTWQVFNWLQHFDSSDIRAELAQNGFDGVEIIPDFAMSSSDGDGAHFGVMARAKA